VTKAVEDDLTHPDDEHPDQPFELRYRHFRVRFSRSRRQPVMTAVNIDGGSSVRIKRRRDRWFADGRVPMRDQPGQDDYDDPEIDRGHMVRREDPNWDPEAQGSASPLAERASADTFHYTNPLHQRRGPPRDDESGKQLCEPPRHVRR
jgi:endonuclease G